MPPSTDTMYQEMEDDDGLDEIERADLSVPRKEPTIQELELRMKKPIRSIIQSHAFQIPRGYNFIDRKKFFLFRDLVMRWLRRTLLSMTSFHNEFIITLYQASKCDRLVADLLPGAARICRYCGHVDLTFRHLFCQNHISYYQLERGVDPPHVLAAIQHPAFFCFVPDCDDQPPEGSVAAFCFYFKQRTVENLMLTAFFECTSIFDQEGFQIIKNLVLQYMGRFGKYISHPACSLEKMIYLFQELHKPRELEEEIKRLFKDSCHACAKVNLKCAVRHILSKNHIKHALTTVEVEKLVGLMKQLKRKGDTYVFQKECQKRPSDPSIGFESSGEQVAIDFGSGVCKKFKAGISESEQTSKKSELNSSDNRAFTVLVEKRAVPGRHRRMNGVGRISKTEPAPEIDSEVPNSSRIAVVHPVAGVVRSPAKLHSKNRFASKRVKKESINIYSMEAEKEVPVTNGKAMNVKKELINDEQVTSVVNKRRISKGGRSIKSVKNSKRKPKSVQKESPSGRDDNFSNVEQLLEESKNSRNVVDVPVVIEKQKHDSIMGLTTNAVNLEPSTPKNTKTDSAIDNEAAKFTAKARDKNRQPVVRVKQEPIDDCIVLDDEPEFKPVVNMCTPVTETCRRCQHISTVLRTGTESQNYGGMLYYDQRVVCPSTSLEHLARPLNSFQAESWRQERLMQPIGRLSEPIMSQLIPGHPACSLPFHAVDRFQPISPLPVAPSPLQGHTNQQRVSWEPVGNRVSSEAFDRQYFSAITTSKPNLYYFK